MKEITTEEAIAHLRSVLSPADVEVLGLIERRIKAVLMATLEGAYLFRRFPEPSHEGPCGPCPGLCDCDCNDFHSAAGMTRTLDELLSGVAREDDGTSDLEW